MKYQTRYVEYSAISPCAKFRMPVVRKIEDERERERRVHGAVADPVHDLGEEERHASDPQVRAADVVVAGELGGRSRTSRSLPVSST